MKRIARDDIRKGIERMKFKWVDQTLKKELPPHIYHGMHYKDQDALGWMKERGYRIEQEGNMVTIFRGLTVIGRKFLVLELKSWEEMDVIVKAAGTIIPPHKVDPDVR
jgi:hypothetical protein